MNIEFHYYAVYFIALEAGLPDEQARIVAHSSQFVDHNIISYRVRTEKGEYRIEPTQNYGFWDDAFPREVYVPFHFFPGDTGEPRAARRDGTVNPFNTTPNSDRVKSLLVEALKSRDLYRIGIALHTYADSWAHQNFTGRLEPWNNLEERTLIPPIGHAQALARPDDLSLVWEDRRLVAENRRITNRRRFERAARQCYKYLCTYNRREYTDLELFDWELAEILGTPEAKASTTERINDFIIHDSLTPYSRNRWLEEALELPSTHADDALFQGYSKVLWLRDALLYRSRLIEQRPVRARPGFFDSHLYRWHEAAGDHRAAARRILSDLRW